MGGEDRHQPQLSSDADEKTNNQRDTEKHTRKDENRKSGLKSPHRTAFISLFHHEYRERKTFIVTKKILRGGGVI